ncbi:DUF4038 domain-containing protein [Paenibacillus sp.]|uniref:apiosidase-like domain-containing protein n=1 Tax=Paenibacillus sp. TaxID=58172 RepID=UPI002810D9E1|nr:DUF4038 domain-containing protein [Paenibacillus sp.]
MALELELGGRRSRRQGRRLRRRAVRGERPLYRHGFVGVHKSGRAFAHADGTPFFWLGDTVWSAPAHATLEEWQRYVTHRGEQGFTVAQINALP